MANQKMIMSVFVFDTQNWYNKNYGGEQRFIFEFDLLCKKIIDYKGGLMFKGNGEIGMSKIIFTIPNQSIVIQQDGILKKSEYTKCNSLMTKITSNETLNNNCKPLFYSKMCSDKQDYSKERLLKDNQNVYDDNLISEELIKLNQLIIYNNWNKKYNVNIFFMSQDVDFCPRLQSFADNNIRVHLICHGGDYGKYTKRNLYKNLQEQDERVKNKNNILLCLESTESFYEKIKFNSNYTSNHSQPSSSLNTESDSSGSEQNNNTFKEPKPRYNNKNKNPIQSTKQNQNNVEQKNTGIVGDSWRKQNNNIQQHQRLTEDQILDQLASYVIQDGNTNLHVASKDGNLDVVRYCVQSCGADIHAKNNDGWTPLNSASRYGYLKVVKYLKSVGADINAKSNNGWTPLWLASLNGHLEVVKYLKSVGADINAKINNGYTPLHSASRNGHLEVVKYLKSVGADINVKSNDGWTPLYSVAFNGHLEVVKYLKSVGADIHAKNNNGDTPLNSASRYGYLEVVKYLKSVGATM